ncbi:MAG: isoprenylcysteine carboxylmethyltransferase family protein [Acidobacteria bacterium]|nr:isoprenylcysteine carboxylmethyltransferase family protein [Acidobacteriota bacterium]
MRNDKFSEVLVYGFAGVTVLAGVGSFVVFGRFLDRMSLGIFQFGLSPVAAAFFDAALCLTFFIQHSGMVRRSFRKWSEQWIPTWLSRALYTFTSAFALVLLSVLWQPVDAAPLMLDRPLNLLLRAVAVLALFSFAWTFVSIEGFDAFGTGDVLARFSRRSRPPVPFSVNGPYRWVRHPFYFLAVVMLWASPVISGDRLLLNTLFTIWIVLGARWEERDLIVQYGDAYRRYQAEVPMLLPWRLPAKLAGAVAH